MVGAIVNEVSVDFYFLVSLRGDMIQKKDILVFFKKIYAHKHHEIKLFNTVTIHKKLLD